jgi:predicted nucleic-acid-binding protein
VIAVDTNVLVRLVTNDDPAQSSKAARLFMEEDVFLSRTVLLEVEWVLRAAYGIAPAVIQGVFERLLEVSSVSLEGAHGVQRALKWFAGGMDFADALHLASSGAESTSFRTFDRALVRRARKLAALPSVELL